jgi:hypothetical protein
MSSALILDYSGATLRISHFYGGLVLVPKIVRTVLLPIRNVRVVRPLEMSGSKDGMDIDE